MNDLISRQAAIDSIEKHLRFGDELYPLTDTDKVLNHAFSIAASCVYNLPSAQQDCTECAEYDHERHYCQKYCDVIRRTLGEAKPERKTGKWIVVDDGCISGKCSVCGWEAHMYEDDVVGMDYCPNCGARLEGEG